MNQCSFKLLTSSTENLLGLYFYPLKFVLFCETFQLSNHLNTHVFHLNVNIIDIFQDCSEENTSHVCYCPVIGPCENNGYFVPLNKLVSDHKHLGDHHREYFFKIKATNIAHLSTTEYKTILVDYSPPEVGSISEGNILSSPHLRKGLFHTLN